MEQLESEVQKVLSARWLIKRNYWGYVISYQARIIMFNFHMLIQVTYQHLTYYVLIINLPQTPNTSPLEKEFSARFLTPN